MKSWLVQKNSVKTPLSRCVGIDACQLTAAVLQKQGPLWACETLFDFSNVPPNQIQDAFIQWVKENKLAGLPCAVSLDYDDYVLSVTSMPAVTEAEQKSALRWKLAEFIDYPSDNAVFDYIALPDARDQKDKSCYIIITPERCVEPWQNLCVVAGLDLRNINIPISGLIELMKHTPQPERGQALIWLSEGKNFILIMKDKHLYMVRELECNSHDPSQYWREELILEIQRSLDYCITRYQDISVVSCWLLSDLPIAAQDFSWLKKELGCELVEYPWQDIFAQNNSKFDFFKHLFSLTTVMAAFDETED